MIVLVFTKALTINPIWDLQMFFCWDHWHSIIHYTSLWHLSLTWVFTEFDVIILNIGFHRASATGVACRQGTLTPPDTWSCPTLGLASVLMLRPISPELVLFLDFWVSNIPRYFCFCFKISERLTWAFWEKVLHKTLWNHWMPNSKYAVMN